MYSQCIVTALTFAVIVLSICQKNFMFHLECFHSHWYMSFSPPSLLKLLILVRSDWTVQLY